MATLLGCGPSDAELAAEARAEAEAEAEAVDSARIAANEAAAADKENRLAYASELSEILADLDEPDPEGATFYLGGQRAAAALNRLRGISPPQDYEADQYAVQDMLESAIARDSSVAIGMATGSLRQLVDRVRRG